MTKESAHSVLLECGHEVAVDGYPEHSAPDEIFCPYCNQTRMTDGARRDLDERFPYENPNDFK